MANLKGGLGEFLRRSRVLIENARGVSAIAQVLVDYGYTDAKLSAEAALVDGVRAKLQNHAHESGAAQESTVGRDKKIAEPDQWVSDLRPNCKVAFAENPQQHEELGIVVLNEPRKKKPVSASAASS